MVVESTLGNSFIQLNSVCLTYCASIQWMYRWVLLTIQFSVDPTKLIFQCSRTLSSRKYMNDVTVNVFRSLKGHHLITSTLMFSRPSTPLIWGTYRTSPGHVIIMTKKCQFSKNVNSYTRIYAPYWSNIYPCHCSRAKK